MSKADIALCEDRLKRYKVEFKSLVPLKKTKEVFARRQQLKDQMNTMKRWIKELRELDRASD